MIIMIIMIIIDMFILVQQNSFRHLRVRLVPTDRGFLPQSN
jgi:hypothetical protein